MPNPANPITRMFLNILHIFHAQSIPIFLAQGSRLRYHAFTLAFYFHWALIGAQFVLLYICGWTLFLKCDGKVPSWSWAKTLSPMLAASGVGVVEVLLCLFRLYVEGKLEFSRQRLDRVLLVVGLVSDIVAWTSFRVFLVLHLDGILVFPSIRLLVLPLTLDLPIRFLNQSANRSIAPHYKPMDTSMYEFTAFLAACKLDKVGSLHWQGVFVFFWILLGSFVIVLCFFCLVNVSAMCRLVSQPRALLQQLLVTFAIGTFVASIILPELITLINLTHRLDGDASVSIASIFVPILVFWSILIMLTGLLFVVLVYTTWLHWDPQSVFFEPSNLRTPQRVVELQPLAEPLELLRLSSSMFRLAEITFDNSTRAIESTNISNNNNRTNINHDKDVDIELSSMEEGKLLTQQQPIDTAATATSSIAPSSPSCTSLHGPATIDTYDVSESTSDRTRLIQPSTIQSHTPVTDIQKPPSKYSLRPLMNINTNNSNSNSNSNSSSSAAPSVSPLLTFGFLSDLTRLVANFTHQHRPAQNLVRDRGLLPLVLSLCRADDSNPMVREWAILATRNLLDNNGPNQEYVRGMVLKGSSDNAELAQMGLKLVVDPEKGRAKLEKL
eukprot:c9811_g1_i1.p1 GENE.c9811_g1_i1~~c9811_g1_i1.p1  ORF type:complete len:624 (+),score=143.69 c9811_g1_i1:42-1874(+)